MSDSILFYSVILLGEFLVLALLAGFLQRLMGWESTFNDNKDRWMSQLQDGRKQMRTVRRKLSGWNEKLVPALFLPNHNLVRGLMWGRLVYKLIARRRTARG